MSIHDSTKLEIVKIVMLKGEKGEKGDGSYDDAEVRGLITAEAQERASGDNALEMKKADKTTIDVLEARMDEFSSLPDGSTSGNAELIDIRVGAKGVTYENAGDAVRKQINDLDWNNKSLESLFDVPNLASNIIDRSGYNVVNGVVGKGSSAKSIIFPVEPSTTYIIVMPINNRSGFASGQSADFKVGQTYQSFSASVTGSNYYIFTTPSNATWVILQYYTGDYNFDKSGFALYKGNSIPDDTNSRLKTSSLPTAIPYSLIADVDVQKTQTEFIRHIEEVNRFDANDADILTGRMIDKNGNLIQLSSQAYMVSGYIPIKPSTEYSVYDGNNSSAQYSADTYYTAIIYSSTKVKIASVTGTLHNGYYTLTTPEDSAYMRVNIYNSLHEFMVVKGQSYPAMYFPYADRFVLDGIDGIETSNIENPLYKKKILWNGDSICAGKAFNDADDAWAGRIANRNNMSYKNYAQGGGTITEHVSYQGVTKHSVCGTLETMHNENPDADYIVIDGGCNDADLLGNMITGTPERLGTYSISDYSGVYDRDTFCGALESIFYRMTNYWKNAKFAFIIPHKMGVNQNGYTATVHNYRAYYELAIKICKKWGIAYLDLWEECYFCPMIAHLCDTNQQMTQQEIYDALMVYADRQHLTSHGYDIESTMIENWLKTI